MQPRDSSHAIGIDVSHYQGEIDWVQVKASGISFVFVKATEGMTLVDDRYASNVTEAGKAGLLVGAYHFCRAQSPADAVREANYFLDSIRSNGGFEQLALAPVLDIETDNGLDKGTLSEIARQWVDTVKNASGRQPMIYTYPYFADNYLSASLADIPLWLANYGVTQPFDHAGWTRWTFLQYSDSGTVPGIQGPVDMNEYDGTEEELMAYQMSPEDANYIIDRWLAHEYTLASDEDKAERHRLANELRKTSGQPVQEE